MDWINIRDQCLGILKKYRYAAIVVLVGIILLCLPDGDTTKLSEPEVQQTQIQEEPDMEASLEEILSQIHGAGKVRVLLTQARGEQTLYQSNEDISTNENSGSSRRDTVLVSDGNRQETGLVSQVISPVYQGAVVVCQGADQASVRLAIVEAVSSVTGLGADHISVLKMK